MFTLLIVLFIAYCTYRFFQTPDVEAINKESEVGIIRDTAKQFKSDLAPIKEQVTTATTNARQSFEDAKHQRRIDALMADPKLLADALEARANSQGQLPTPPPPPPSA